MLFYYFNNKQELYHDLAWEDIRIIEEEYLSQLDAGETDFIEKYRKASEIKMKAYHGRPHVYEFFGRIYLELDETELSKEIAEKLIRVREFGFGKIYSNIDTSLFRQDIPPQRTMRLIVRCMGGYEKEMSEQLKKSDWVHADYDMLLKEFNEFLADLKTVFYR